MRYLRNILVILVGIGLIVLTFVVIARGFSSGKTAVAQNHLNLPSYAHTGAEAQLYMDGPVVLDQLHRATRIVVGQNSTRIDIIAGYQDTVIATQSYPNNSNAYSVFLSALELQNFTIGNTNPKLVNSSGYCPKGNVYTYSFNQGSTQLQSLWNTSCSVGIGTFKGNGPTIRQLFIAQIPPADYTALTTTKN